MSSESKTPKDHLSKFDKRRPAGYPSDKEVPVVLVLKRKAIRVYPDNQKVVLYYSQALDKYVSIPFGPKSDVLGSPLNEAKKPKDDNTYEALVKKYPAIAAQYKAAKEEQPERRGLRKVVKKLTPSQIMSLPPEERKVAYGMAKQMIKASDMSTSRKLGVSHALALKNVMAKIKDKKTKKTPKATPTSSAKGADVMPPSMGKTQVSTRPQVAESFKQRVSLLREKYNKIDAALDAASFFPGVGSVASLASAGRSLSRGEYGNAALDAIGALPVVGSAAKAAKVAKVAAKTTKAGRAATKAVRASKIGKAARRLRIGGKRLVKKHGGKLAAAGAGIAAAADAVSGADAAIGRAEKVGQEMSGKREYAFTLDPRERVSDPSRQRSTISAQDKYNADRLYKEQTNLDKIKHIVENDINSYEMTFNENDSTINLNNRVAKKVLQVYESLNTKNKKKFSKMLNENATTFKQAINFVIRH